MSSAIVVYKYQQFVTRMRFIMNTKYEIECAVSECTSKRGWKKNVSIHRFPKRENAGQRWITMDRRIRKSLLVEVKIPSSSRKTIFSLSSTFR